MSKRDRKTYDHRLRALVWTTGDPQPAMEIGVPRSTVEGWLRDPPPEIVTLDVLDMDNSQLQQEFLVLRRRNRKLLAIMRLLLSLLRLSGFKLGDTRLPDGEAKSNLLSAIGRSRTAFSLRSVLRILSLSPTRYHAWRRAQAHCDLEDRSSCPRTSPQQLTPEEVRTIRQMVTSEEYRHVPTGILAILAQRLGKVFVSPTTWYRLVRRFGWRRPRTRVHPGKPRNGLRAVSPNEIWHVDTTIIRLLDGTKAYLHAVIDNFSRRILAWRVVDKFEVGSTIAILSEAGKALFSKDEVPTLIADQGVENVNDGVDELVRSGLLRRVLAMTEITFSNSLIEAWWRVLKHQWLFLNTLDSIAAVRRLVTFYVKEYNSRLPHSAFRGQTPDEMYFATGEHVPGELQAAREEAQRNRMEANRAMDCPECPEWTQAPEEEDAEAA